MPKTVPFTDLDMDCDWLARDPTGAKGRALENWLLALECRDLGLASGLERVIVPDERVAYDLLRSLGMPTALKDIGDPIERKAQGAHGYMYPGVKWDQAEISIQDRLRCMARDGSLGPVDPS